MSEPMMNPATYEQLGRIADRADRDLDNDHYGRQYLVERLIDEIRELRRGATLHSGWDSNPVPARGRYREVTYERLPELPRRLPVGSTPDHMASIQRSFE